MSQDTVELAAKIDALQKSVLANLLKVNNQIRKARSAKTNDLETLKAERAKADRLLSRVKIIADRLDKAEMNSALFKSYSESYHLLRQEYLGFN